MDEEAIAQRQKRSETSKTPRIVAIDTTDGVSSRHTIDLPIDQQ